MKIKEYIDEIVENGSKEYMEELSDMFEELVCDLKENDYSKYKKYKTKLFGMANDYKFDKDSAYEVVSDMKPLGEVWALETTNQVKNQFGLTDISDYDFYIVMNSLANDYGQVIPTSEVETYVKLAKAWIDDEDAVDNKVWKYFTKITKEED